MARFLLMRVAEKFNVDVSFAPKLFQTWNGSGAHTNYSNNDSRNDTKMTNIKAQLEKLGKYHQQFFAMY